jgi:hypothetical protein
MFLSGDELARLLIARDWHGTQNWLLQADNKPQSLRRCFRDKDLFAMRAGDSGFEMKQSGAYYL